MCMATFRLQKRKDFWIYKLAYWYKTICLTCICVYYPKGLLGYRWTTSTQFFFARCFGSISLNNIIVSFVLLHCQILGLLVLTFEKHFDKNTTKIPMWKAILKVHIPSCSAIADMSIRKLVRKIKSNVIMPFTCRSDTRLVGAYGFPLPPHVLSCWFGSYF